MVYLDSESRMNDAGAATRFHFTWFGKKKHWSELGLVVLEGRSHLGLWRLGGYDWIGVLSLSFPLDSGHFLAAHWTAIAYESFGAFLLCLIWEESSVPCIFARETSKFEVPVQTKKGGKELHFIVMLKFLICIAVNKKKY
jgi:hypothetical protein